MFRKGYIRINSIKSWVLAHLSIHFFFYWHRESRNSVSINPGGTQALGKEFPASAPPVIYGKNLSVWWPLEIVCTQWVSNLRPGWSIPPRPRPLPLKPTPRGYPLELLLKQINAKEICKAFGTILIISLSLSLSDDVEPRQGRPLRCTLRHKSQYTNPATKTTFSSEI